MLCKLIQELALQGYEISFSINYAFDGSSKEGGHSGFSWGMTRQIFDRLAKGKPLTPITMPYYPGDAIKVVCEDYLTDSKNGDFDTVGILYAIKPDGERVEINRYFKEGEDDFIEIAFCEYEMRRKMHRELKKDCHSCFGAASDECSRCMEES